MNTYIKTIALLLCGSIALNMSTQIRAVDWEYVAKASTLVTLAGSTGLLSYWYFSDDSKAEKLSFTKMLKALFGQQQESDKRNGKKEHQEQQDKQGNATLKNTDNKKKDAPRPQNTIKRDNEENLAQQINIKIHDTSIHKSVYSGLQELINDVLKTIRGQEQGYNNVALAKIAAFIKERNTTVDEFMHCLTEYRKQHFKNNDPIREAIVKKVNVFVTFINAVDNKTVLNKLII